MLKITADTRPVDIEELKPYADYLMYKCVPVDRPAVEMTFAEMNENQPTWNVDSMIRGMERLREVAKERKVMYDVYTEQECSDDPVKKDIKLFFLPSKVQPSDKPFIICVAGGAYTCVCSIVESFPTAARFNELGYNVFVFNYHVGNGTKTVLPAPEEDLAAADFAETFKNKAFLDPAVKGVFPQKLVEILRKDGVLWESTPEELALIQENMVDFLGVNYYQPFRAQAQTAFDDSKGWLPEKYFAPYEMPGRRMNPYRGWEIYPQAIYDIAINIRDNYGNIPWYVSENGMGVEGEEKFRQADGRIADDYRIDFIKEHLEWLHRGIAEGSNCFGYHLWTPIDCWSWSNAYKNRYGLIALDLANQQKTLKKSAYWFRDLVANNGFTE